MERPDLQPKPSPGSKINKGTEADPGESSLKRLEGRTQSQMSSPTEALSQLSKGGWAAAVGPRPGEGLRSLCLYSGSPAAVSAHLLLSLTRLAADCGTDRSLCEEG